MNSYEKSFLATFFLVLATNNQHKATNNLFDKRVQCLYVMKKKNYCNTIIMYKYTRRDFVLLFMILVHIRFRLEYKRKEKKMFKLEKLFYCIPSIRNLKEENKKLRKLSKLYYTMYQKQTEKVFAYQDTLNEFSEQIVQKQIKDKEIKEQKIVPVQKKQRPSVQGMNFTKIKPEDETTELVEKIVNSSPFGMASNEYDGEVVKYQQLTEEMIEGLFKYCYENPTKEVNLELGNSINGRITGILESHNDNELSIEIYEEGKHLKSLKTGEKEINDELVSDYNEQDIIRVLNSYGQRGMK